MNNLYCGLQALIGVLLKAIPTVHTCMVVPIHVHVLHTLVCVSGYRVNCCYGYTRTPACTHNYSNSLTGGKNKETHQNNN